MAALQRLAQLLRPREAAHFDRRAHVGQVGGNASGVGHVIEGELADQAAALEQQREWLTDAARGAEQGDLGLRGRRAQSGVKRRQEAYAASSWARGAARGPRTLVLMLPGSRWAARRFTRSMMRTRVPFTAR